MEERKIEHLIEDLRDNAQNKRTAALLIGAGCSRVAGVALTEVQAGVPLAWEFVAEIKRDYTTAYNRATDKTYAVCMGAMAPGDRHALISKYVDQAKINIAHIAIAQLIKGKFVDRVLTTNFDPLVVRGCALAHVFPAVYDMAASSRFSPGMIRGEAVFHLHGQRDGFVQLHKDDQFEKLEHALQPLFSNTNDGRTWIVAGYSGENDPVFEQLAKLPDYICLLPPQTKPQPQPP